MCCDFEVGGLRGEGEEGQGVEGEGAEGLEGEERDEMCREESREGGGRSRFTPSYDTSDG